MACYNPDLFLQKLLNGNVNILDNTTGDLIKTLSPDIVRIEVVGEKLNIIQDNGSIETIDSSKVLFTQVVPAAPVGFAGDVQALAVILVTDFFFVANGPTAVTTNLYGKGTYNTFFETTTNVIAYAAFNTALMLYQDFAVLAPVTLDAIKFATNSNPAGQASFTLYSASLDGEPDAKIVEVTFNTATVAGVQIITFAEQTLEAGIYFWAIQSNSAFNLWTTPKSNNQFSFLGREGGASVTPLLQKYISPHVYATPTPATATAPTNDFYNSPTAVFFVQSRIKA